MGDTTISWTDKTWNPIRGCRRISAGCENCYAERQANRFAGAGGAYDGLVKLTANGPRWTGATKFVEEHLADPLRWKKPLRIFVDSMSDLFYEGFTNEQIAAVFGIMAAAPQHTFQVLTKRSRRMREWFEWAESTDDIHGVMHVEAGPHIADAIGDDDAEYEEDDPAEVAAHRLLDAEWPLPNVWLGVSVEDQAAANERIPDLLATPAAIRFLSCEPLLGPVDLSRWLHRCASCVCSSCPPGFDDDTAMGQRRLSWVIAGAESGPRARECNVEWLRSLMQQCAAAGVARFLKQAVALSYERRVYPSSQAAVVTTEVVSCGDGSRAKGRGFGGPVIELPYLDGKQWAEFPEAKR